MVTLNKYLKVDNSSDFFSYQSSKTVLSPPRKLLTITAVDISGQLCTKKKEISRFFI